MNWKDIPLPANMQHLPKDDRGFPVPYVVLKDAKGQYNFRVNDEIKNRKCMAKKLCNICGKELGADMWLIGGQLSTFHEQGAFNDTPVHKECGEYALQVCPYMAYTQYKQKPLDTGKISMDVPMIYFDPTQDKNRLDFFCFSHTKDFTVKWNGIMHFVHPVKPYIETRYWKDGVEISVLEAKALLKSLNKESYLP